MAKTIDTPESWDNFDNSPLSTLLLHDTWNPRLAIPLICNIDPERPSLFSPEAYYETVLIEDWMESDHPQYWRIRLLSDKSDKNPRVCYEKGEYDELPLELKNQISPHLEAESSVKRLWQIFFSNPDHEYTKNYPPNYFIDWALSKGAAIPWLEWAKNYGLISNDSADPIASVGDDEIHPRKEATYQRIIGSLLELLTGKTNGRPNSIYRNQEAIVQEVIRLYGDRGGISERNLDAKFAEAKRRLETDY